MTQAKAIKTAIKNEIAGKTKQFVSEVAGDPHLHEEGNAQAHAGRPPTDETAEAGSVA